MPKSTDSDAVKRFPTYDDDRNDAHVPYKPDSDAVKVEHHKACAISVGHGISHCTCGAEKAALVAKVKHLTRLVDANKAIYHHCIDTYKAANKALSEQLAELEFKLDPNPEKKW